MTVLLDESVPLQLAYRLPGHGVETVRSMSWLGVQNGSLMRLVGEFFEVFITADKNMMYQQSTQSLPFSLIVLSTNSWPILKQHLPLIREAIETTPAGEIRELDCGKFLSAKQRRKQQQKSVRPTQDE